MSNHTKDETTTMKASAAPEEEEEEDDIVKLQEEIRKMEEEAARISQQTEELKSASSSSHNVPGSEKTLDPSKHKKDSAANATAADDEDEGNANAKKSTDGFSIYVGQVEYSATPEELLAHFQPCGVVERVTIVCDKMTGHSKGYAYIEFQTEEAMKNAVKLNGSTFKDRELKVMMKRVNEPGYHYRGGGGGRFPGGGRGGRGGRFPGGRGRGRGRFHGGGRGGGYHPYSYY